jgi:hypothetical protein
MRSSEMKNQPNKCIATRRSREQRPNVFFFKNIYVRWMVIIEAASKGILQDLLLQACRRGKKREHAHKMQTKNEMESISEQANGTAQHDTMQCC